MKETFKIKVNELDIEAQYDMEKIDEVFLPLMQKWTRMYEESGKRVIVMLAAAPGVGKSTLALFLQQYSEQLPDVCNIQAVAMDGFFYKPEYLKSHYLPDGKTFLQEMKGAPETYDVPLFIEKIKEAKEKEESWWPIYNRAAHCPEDDKLLVNGKVVLIEGNYLLLNEEPWTPVKDLADDTIFISSDPDWLKQRLVGRKMQSGYDAKFSDDFFYNVDRVNAIRINQNSEKGNTNLYMSDEGDYLPIE
ncbi:MAG: nucleoside/nucleotide kinase family protein [Erysipelotrichaceae bacterium]|nr:nucleoside/nucleotide kinase family protein [Erysipelotrichaceae bacterium]